eukprot:TRINITY_DN4020_c2_g1_i8.p1 TRINITY_DN4020_c2_g1~~TRINITY_DN4020_c2_g1_i8.p1  ORF type:complete len:624 (+),score=132.96 TRINITY_DN4020_c2_g1_i8:311-2182(+)
MVAGLPITDDEMPRLDACDDAVFTEHEVDDSLTAMQRLTEYASADGCPLLVSSLARVLPDAAADATPPQLALEVFPAAAAIAQHPDPAVREAVAGALGGLMAAAAAADATEAAAKMDRSLSGAVVDIAVFLLRDGHPAVATAALETVHSVAATATPEAQSELLCESFGEGDEGAVLAAAVLAEVAPHIKPAEGAVEAVLSLLGRFASHFHADVRHRAAAALGAVAGHVGQAAAAARVLPHYVELSKDVSGRVRAAAAGASAALAEHLPPGGPMSTLAGCFEKLLSDGTVPCWPSNDAVCDIANSVVGEVIHFLGKEHGSAFLEHFRYRGHNFDIVLKRAYSFPAVVKVLGPDCWEMLSDYFRELCMHVHWRVRRTMACALHEFVDLLSPADVSGHVVDVLESMFLRDLDEVCVCAVRNVAKVVQCAESDAKTCVVHRLCAIRSEAWRTRACVAEQLGPIAEVVPTALVQSELAPAVIRHLQDETAEVLASACDSVGQVLAVLAQDGDSSRLLQFVLGMGTEKKFQRRQQLIRVASSVATHSTAAFFAEHFLEPVLRLAKDPVVNVRIGVAKCLADPCRGICRSEPWAQKPDDSSKRVMKELGDALDALRQDSSSDVRHFSCGG